MKFITPFWDLICCGKHPQSVDAACCITQEQNGAGKLLDRIVAQ